jgi:hypothetical protein
MTVHAWEQDILVSGESDSVDVVTLVADPCDAGHLYALLARTQPPGRALRDFDEVAVSCDGGISWQGLCFPGLPQLGRGGIDMALGEAFLGVAESRIASSGCSLVVCFYDSNTGDLVRESAVLTDLPSVGDVSFCSDQDVGQPGNTFFLAAVLDQGRGSQLYFTRSLDGGATWQDEVVLATGGLGWIDLTYVPGSGGHIELAYILDGNLFLAVNFDCGHSEYWGEMYWGAGPVEEGAHPSVAGRDSVIVAAVGVPDGNVEYYFSLDAGLSWHCGGVLAGTAHHETSPVLAADASGLFHLLYTDATECRTYHRASLRPEDPLSWTMPVPVSDGDIRVGPETTHLEARSDPAGGAGALFVTAGHRLVCFDVDGGGAAAVRDGRRDAAPGGDQEASFVLRLAGPNPTRFPVHLTVCHVAGGRADRSPPSAGTTLDGEIRLEILDATGRRVRSIPLARMPPLSGLSGERVLRILWDGLDQQQHPVSPGLYVARLCGSGMNAIRSPARTARILIIR